MYNKEPTCLHTNGIVILIHMCCAICNITCHESCPGYDKIKEQAFEQPICLYNIPGYISVPQDSVRSVLSPNLSFGNRFTRPRYFSVYCNDFNPQPAFDFRECLIALSEFMGPQFSKGIPRGRRRQSCQRNPRCHQCRSTAASHLRHLRTWSSPQGGLPFKMGPHPTLDDIWD